MLMTSAFRGERAYRSGIAFLVEKLLPLMIGRPYRPSLPTYQPVILASVLDQLV